MDDTLPITYEDYCIAVASVQLSPNKVQALSLPGPLMKLVAALKENLTAICEAAGVGMRELLRALANRDAFAFFKAIKFNLSLLMRGFHYLVALIPRGLTALFRELQDAGVLQRIQDGALAVDDFLANHPVAKRLAGPALAALLFWMWTQAMFVGDPWTDFDFSQITAALAGHYTFYDLFASPEGLAGLAIFAAGLLTPGLGIAWLGSDLANIVLACAWTVSRKHFPNLASRLKKLIPKMRVIQGL